MWQRLGFELWYRLGRPPWDTGVTPPEIVALVEDRPPGRALDLGCGTGTNAVYLARRGWEVVGVDFASRAIELARRRAAAENVAGLRFLRADVTDPPDLGGPFDLAYDIGCLHAVPTARRSRYVASLASVLRSGAPYALYAFTDEPGPARPGIPPAEVERLFAADFRLDRYEEGTNRPSRWYWFARR